MTRTTLLKVAVALALVAVQAAAVRAQSGPAPPPAGDDRDEARRPVAAQMRRVFAARLKSDVGLDDAQVAAVLPKIVALENDRTRANRDRILLLRDLRAGLAGGMSDPELQQRLNDLDRIAQDLERSTRAALGDIDRDLSVPQRVRLRFLIVDFRREVTRRIRDFGAGGSPGVRRYRGGLDLAPAP